MNELSWDGPIEHLYKGKNSKTVLKLKAAGIEILSDLLWILPNRIESIPALSSFDKALPEELFQGRGNIIDLYATRSVKHKAPLQNITAIIKDSLSSHVLTLKWFNAYPSTYQQIKACSHIIFLGKVSSFRGERYIASPEILKEERSALETITHYPIINGISGKKIGEILSRIPENLWNHIPPKVPLPSCYMVSRQDAFLTLHGRTQKFQKEEAIKTLAYEEFYCEQLKILIRRKFLRNDPAQTLSSNINPSDFYSTFPYELTSDQKSSCHQIAIDLQHPTPMMRLLQGDVGCGKTTVAIISALMAIKSGWQVAIMCPTESLAFQHFYELTQLTKEINIDLLVGSLSAKAKNELKLRLQTGFTQLVVGTHALIEESTTFENLGLVVIDEQHKFGVNQRLRLIQKNAGTHCLIMSATPIPRSLSLTQYGDLDISTIKTIPKNRKKIKTRIVLPENFGKFLNFIQTRLDLKEQIYLVTPAILENETQDLLNVEKVYRRFATFFAQAQVRCLHGKMPSPQKQETLIAFSNKKIDILISTSVVEVGINVPSATIMAILNPERFGLSSLHQLRGRVGRAQLPGFCFLVCDKIPSSHALERLSIIENNLDGFSIAEHDLRLRGHGSLYGTEQSGKHSSLRIANLLSHYQQLKDARSQVQSTDLNQCPLSSKILKQLTQTPAITSTI